ncbi:MAG: DUF3310 domain-containing protein [Methanothrix sp.]|nr:DUF3310 domain-containing protein [Methanothrix sp.]
MKQKETKVKGNIVPKHYVKGGMHLLEILEMKVPPEQIEGFLRCTLLKYIFRYDEKNGVEDLKKALWYLNELIDLKEKKDENNK